MKNTTLASMHLPCNVETQWYFLRSKNLLLQCCLYYYKGDVLFNKNRLFSLHGHKKSNHIGRLVYGIKIQKRYLVAGETMEHFSRAYFSRTRSRLLKKDNSYSRIQLKLVLTLEIHVLHQTYKIPQTWIFTWWRAGRIFT